MDEAADHPRSKRRGPRVQGPFKARWLGALTVPLVIHDLSVGGCMIMSTDRSLPSRNMVLEIDLPDGECVTVEAQPLYVRKDVGFAVKFVNVPDATDMRLARAVAGLVSAAGKGPSKR